MPSVVVTSRCGVQAALERRWVVETGSAEVVGNGMLAVHPGRAAHDSAARALEMVRALRLIHGEGSTSEETSSLLVAAFAKAEATLPEHSRTPEVLVARTSEILSTSRSARSAVEDNASSATLGRLVAPLFVAGPPQSAATARAVLGRMAGWTGARLTHWDRLAQSNRDVLVFADAPEVLDVNLYGLLSCPEFTIHADRDIHSAVLDLLGDRVQRAGALELSELTPATPSSPADPAVSQLPPDVPPTSASIL